VRSADVENIFDGGIAKILDSIFHTAIIIQNINITGKVFMYRETLYLSNRGQALDEQELSTFQE
jgi:hypothetical protein